MECPQGEDHIEQFVIELLSTASMLLGVIRDLADALPADAYPDEEPSAVVVEMVFGTIATALGAVDPDDVRTATRLIDLASTQVLEHLQLACALSRRSNASDHGGRTYG
ncbi:MAG TPA: hypothetical protein VMJ65_06505 [Solirubrobacteraceae bacterium]|nr:hypothetical protein [Solirubrobacteraceae bacterium]